MGFLGFIFGVVGILTVGGANDARLANKDKEPEKKIVRTYTLYTPAELRELKRGGK
jgi:hypothetical protein